MLLCTLSLPLQSYLGLPEDPFFFTADGQSVCIECRTINVAELVSYTGENYDWLMKEDGVDKLALAAKGSDGKPIFIRYVYKKINDESFTGGMVNPKQLTRLQLSFEIESLEPIDNKFRFQELKQWASLVIKRFIDLYRMVSQEGDVVGFRLEEIPIMDVWVASEYTFDSRMIDAKQTLHTRVWDWSSTMKTNYFKKVLPDKSLHLFGYLLKRDIPIRLFEQLLLECKEQSQVGGQHELAIVNAGTALEAFLKERLTHECVARGITQLPFGRKNAKELVPYEDALEKGNIREDLLAHVEVIGGQKLKGGPEYTDWFNIAYKPRNEIIHQGKRGFTEDDAAKAYLSVGALITLINSVLGQNSGLTQK